MMVGKLPLHGESVLSKRWSISNCKTEAESLNIPWLFVIKEINKLLGEMFGCNYPNPYATFEILVKAEREARRRTTLECNQSFSEEESDKWYENFVRRLTKKLGVEKMPEGFFINYDPRGHALKMKEGTFPEGFWRDFGGYGVLVPEF